MAHDECPMAATLKEGLPVRGRTAVLERPDGARITFAPYPALLRDDSGAVIGAINMLIDVEGQQEAELQAARLAAIVERIRRQRL